MNYRPYPDVDRALAQLERGRIPEPPQPPIITSFAQFHAYMESGEFARRMLAMGETVSAILNRRAGKSAITAAIVDQAVNAGEHVHVAGRDGVRCAGDDPSCSLPSKTPAACPGCGHAPHAPGTECEAGVDHGPKRWHACLCLAMPGASRACPPQMDCQGGRLGYADIVHLRAGRSVRGAGGETITPDVLSEPYAERKVSDQ